MNSKNKLLLGQGLLTVIIIVAFGLIIINEKKTLIFGNTIDKKMNKYIEDKYSSLEDTTVSELIVNNNSLKRKIISNKNKNLYFEIYYEGSTIKDTYQKDYIEGKKYLNYISKKLEKEILEESESRCEIIPLNTLNNYSESIQKRLLEEDKLLELHFYYLKQELITDNWDSQSITKLIINKLNYYEENNIHPKYFVFVITNKDKKDQSIEISYITNSFLNLNNKEEIISDILNNYNSTGLKEAKIQYKYL